MKQSFVKEVVYWETKRGKRPVEDWLLGLKDVRARLRIAERLERLGRNHLGDAKGVGGGVHELRFTFGPAYRVYFAFDGSQLVVLLAAGDKSTQAKDIKTAKRRWKDYMDEKKEDNKQNN